MFSVGIHVRLETVLSKETLHYFGLREASALKCKLKCDKKPMKDPLGVSPSKANQGTTRGKTAALIQDLLQRVGLSWVSHSTLIYTSELIFCSTICVHSATRHNIHMYPYLLFAAIHHPNRPRLSLSDLIAQSAE